MSTDKKIHPIVWSSVIFQKKDAKQVEKHRASSSPSDESWLFIFQGLKK
jgi:hypothetical protein